MAARNEHLDNLARGIDMWLTWEPLGPFLIVTPGNIPMHAWSSFVPYALAAGCSVVVSPSRQDPVAAEYMCKGCPGGRFPGGGHQPDPRRTRRKQLHLGAAGDSGHRLYRLHRGGPGSFRPMRQAGQDLEPQRQRQEHRGDHARRRAGVLPGLRAPGMLRHDRPALPGLGQRDYYGRQRPATRR